MTQTIDLLANGQTGALTVHGMDDETKALLGYLARYKGKTLENYELDLRQFKQWATTFGLTNVLHAERYQLELYVRHMQERGLAASTINRRLDDQPPVRHRPRLLPLRACRRADRQGPVGLRRYPEDRAGPAVPHLLRDDRHGDRDASRDRPTGPGRDAAHVRPGVACERDVQPRRRQRPAHAGGVFLRFVGKGGKLADMLIPAASLQAVDAYLTASGGRTSGPLFLNHWGNRMSRANVQAIITRLSKQAGISYRVTPHGIRRSHARIAVQQGSPIDKVADNLRHKDSRVTKSCYAIATGTADIGRLQLSAVMANLSQ